MGSCFRCGAVVAAETRVLREAVCPECDADLHCCRNCRFHDPSRNNQCSEPQAEWVTDKERANFCDFFQIARRGSAEGKPGAGDTGRAAWDRLFKK